MSRPKNEIADTSEGGLFQKISRWMGLYKGGKGLSSILMSKTQFRFKQMQKDRDKGVVRDFSRLDSGGVAGRVSIILLVEDDAVGIELSIQSVLDQSHSDWELIVADTTAGETGKEFWDSFQPKDSRIQFRGMEQATAVDALNDSHKMARGEFVTWISNGTVLSNDFLSLFVRKFSQRLDVSMFFGNFTMIENSGESPRTQGKLSVAEGETNTYATPDVSCMHEMDIVGPAFSYRRSAYLLLGGYVETGNELYGYDFFLRMNCQFKIRHIGVEESMCRCRTKSTVDGHSNEITKRQALDDGRWDLLAGSMAWTLESDGTDAADDLVSQWGEMIRNAGERVVERDSDFSEWQSPIACVQFVSEISNEPKPTAPRTGFEARILIACGKEPGASADSGQWDAHVFLGKSTGQDSNWLTTEQLECAWHACRVRAWSQHCQKCEENFSSATEDEYRLSVVVCTNRDPQLLSAVVESFPENIDSKVEIILVNNDPDRYCYDSTKEVLLKNAYSDSDVRIINCYPMGLSFGRNAGLRVARGKAVLYLDDDVIVDPELFSKVADAFDKDNDLGVLGGTIEMRHPDPCPSWYVDSLGRFWSAFEAKQPEFYTTESWLEFPFGANWTGRRKGLTAIGGFRNRYGRGSGFADSSEEMVAALGIQKIGYSVGIEGTAKVTHQVETDRFTLPNLRRIIIGGYHSAWCMSCEERIGRLMGPKGTILRMGYYFLMTLIPYPIGAHNRLENRYRFVGIIKYTYKSVHMFLQRFGKHPTLLD